MPAPRFFVSRELHEGLEFELNEATFRHSVTVLRLQTDAPVILFDGRGGQYQARLAAIGRRKAVVQVGVFEPTDCESPLKITLGQALTKGERMDFTLQKAVELGVETIIPLWTERTTVRLAPDRVTRRMRHWQGVMVSACEQCGRNRIPTLEEPRTLEASLKQCSPGLRMIADPRANSAIKDCDHTTADSPTLSVFVGPEGGFSDSEIQRAEAQGFQPVRLGPRILRTETAAIAALSLIQSQWGDFR